MFIVPEGKHIVELVNIETEEGDIQLRTITKENINIKHHQHQQ